jgi:hypothetical protein
MTEAMSLMRQFVDVDDAAPASQRRYGIYHRSFADFLLDRDRAETCWCVASEQHERIARGCRFWLRQSSRT